MHGIEKRRFRRVPMVTTIQIEIGDARVNAEARNISTNGMLIRSSQTFGENQQVRIWFTIPGTSQPLSVRGTILHVSPDAYMGVRFDEVSAQAGSFIESYVESSRETS